MNKAKILSDLIGSAAGAKIHFDVWWAQVSEAKPAFVPTMNRHVDFFRASQDAHYTACFIYLAHLFDKRSDTSSLTTYLSLIRPVTPKAEFQEIESRYSDLACRAAPLITVRHKAVAHIDARLSESDIFAPLNITWNAVRTLVYDAATFVEYLASAPNQGAIGIPRDGRLGEATIRLLKSLSYP